DQTLFESVDRLPDNVRYEPLGRKSLLRRIGLRGLDPALFDRPKSGFVLPYERWIRSGLSDAIDRTMRDPLALRPVGLDPEAVARLWRAYRDGAPGLYWSRVWAVYVLALGRDRVEGLFMPERDSSDDALRLGRMVAEQLGIPTKVENIAPTLAAIGCYDRQNEAIRTVFPEYGDGWKCKFSLPSILE